MFDTMLATADDQPGILESVFLTRRTGVNINSNRLHKCFRHHVDHRERPSRSLSLYVNVVQIMGKESNSTVRHSICMRKLGGPVLLREVKPHIGAGEVAAGCLQICQFLGHLRGTPKV